MITGSMLFTTGLTVPMIQLVWLLQIWGSTFECRTPPSRPQPLGDATAKSTLHLLVCRHITRDLFSVVLSAFIQPLNNHESSNRCSCSPFTKTFIANFAHAKVEVRQKEKLEYERCIQGKAYAPFRHSGLLQQQISNHRTSDVISGSCRSKSWGRGKLACPQGFL